MWYKFAKMIRIANEYWIHDGETEFADGDIGDKNHEMIAEDYIIQHFIPNIPEHLYDYGLSKDVLNDYAPKDLDFIEHLMEKYNYEKDDAIDNAYFGNYIRWLITGNDEAESPIIQELLHALKDPRKYAVEKLGWIRVQDNNIEMKSLDDASINNLIDGLWEIYGDKTLNIKLNIYVSDIKKYFEGVTVDDLESGEIKNRALFIEDVPTVKRLVPPTKVPGYNYVGGSTNH